MTKPHFNCTQNLELYLRDEGITEKRVVVVDPPYGRERIMIRPLIDYISQFSQVNFDTDNIWWNETGGGIPDAKIPVNGSFSEAWIEHTRVFDSQQHFVNEDLKKFTEQCLNSLNAPLNLAIRFVEGTTRREAKALCESWSSWEEVEDTDKLFVRIQVLDSTNINKNAYGFKIKNNSSPLPRLILLESANRSIFEMFKEAIETKELKYGLTAVNTILVLDDESRCHLSEDIIRAANLCSKQLKSSFKGIYVISFDQLNDNNLPSWRIGVIKTAVFI